MVGRGGSAVIGDYGLGVARAEGASIDAGEEGQAVAVGFTPSLRVGARGVAVALSGARHVRGGANSIAIIRHPVDRVTRVCLGTGSLAIMQWEEMKRNGAEII